MDFLPDSGEDVRGSGERNDETDSPEPHSGFQGEGGDGLIEPDRHVAFGKVFLPSFRK